MYKPSAKQAGFTIVELLIVIVVIGILAAIAIVAYSGIQSRANNTARVSAASDYVKLLTLYAVQNGKYPAVTDAACLGGSYAGNVCGALDAGFPATATVQSSFTAALQTVGTLPSYPLLNATGTGSGSAAGMFIYQYGPTNETPPRGWRLVYWLEGSNQDCTLARIARNTDGSPAGTGAWTIGVNSGAKNSNSSQTTLCIVSLFNPDEF